MGERSSLQVLLLVVGVNCTKKKVFSDSSIVSEHSGQVKSTILEDTLGRTRRTGTAKSKQWLSAPHFTAAYDGQCNTLAVAVFWAVPEFTFGTIVVCFPSEWMETARGR